MQIPLDWSSSRRRGSAFAALVLTSAFGSIFVLSCSDKSGSAASGTTATTGATTTSSASTTTSTDTKDEDDVRPLYPVDGSPADPLAERFCKAITDTEPSRHGECCGTPGDMGHFTGECTRELSAAMRLKAVTLDAADVDKCRDALVKDMDGCGWVGPVQPTFPAECDGIIHGTLAEKAVCRSSLECAGTLRCQGLTATRTGKCAPPKVTGILCGGTTDTLAALTRQNGTDFAHPECKGFCARNVCKEVSAAGGPCKRADECGGKHACIDEKCSPDPFPSAGQACAAGQCAAGARCIKDKCVAPKAEGEACDADIDCRGACLKADAKAPGKCGKRCVVLGIPTNVAFTTKPVAPTSPPRSR